jgi:hypothetical protein
MKSNCVKKKHNGSMKEKKLTKQFLVPFQGSIDFFGVD